MPSIESPPSIRRDILSAYVAAGARVGAWAVVSAIVYRLGGPAHFAMLALIRGTIGILNYTAVGLLPALIRMFAEARGSNVERSNLQNPLPCTQGRGQGEGQVVEERNLQNRPSPQPSILRMTRLNSSKSGEWEQDRDPDRSSPKDQRTDDCGSVGSAPRTEASGARGTVRSADPTQTHECTLFSTGIVVAGASTVIGLVITALYSTFFQRLHVVPPELARQAPWAVLLIGAGTLLRLFSDVFGATLQTQSRIAQDNLLRAFSDFFWALLTVAFFCRPGLLTASATYAIAGAALLAGRSVAVALLDDTPWPPRFQFVHLNVARRLLAFGSLVLLAQLAEYFYAPTDYILINHFFGAAEVAAYAPGVQIDMALLMLVLALAAVLLPRSAMAHAAGETDTLSRYYLRGTLVSAALLILAAACVLLLYPLIFHLWFGPHPPDTWPILPLILISTVVGGSSAVGRSILIGMGKVKPFTIAAILAGVTNVAASYCFVKYADLGLRGIIYGTLLAVIGRCGIWMPWYVLRTLKRERKKSPGDDIARAGNLRF